MNDRPDLPSSDDDSAETAEVRRLLADARHTAPMPEDVVVRMNRVIDRLGDQSPAARIEPRVGEVIPIAAQRRRRVAGLLVAAAAIVVGGVVVSQNLDGTGTSSATSAGSEAGSQGAAQSKGAQDFDSSTSVPSSPNPLVAGRSAKFRHGRLVVRPRHFSLDALAGRTYLARESASAQALRPKDCDVRHQSEDEILAAKYRNAPAALVYQHPQGSSQVVYLFVCGSSEPIKTTTLPAP